MESSMTEEKMIEQAEKQIAELEKWNAFLGNNISTDCDDMCRQAEQVRINILAIRELQNFLWKFNRKMFKNEGLGENERGTIEPET